MALHDLWHFENAPVGLNLAVAAYQTTYQPSTIYNQYTGNIGQPMTFGTTNTLAATADGWFLNSAGSTGNGGGIFAPINGLQDWTTPTQYWVGFRTKLTAANTVGGCHVAVVTNNTSFSNWVSMCDESHLIAAGLQTIGYEVFIEIFLDRSALTFQTYANGLLINSGALNTASFLNSGFIMFGQFVTGSVNAARAYRDFYFLDVDSTTPGRLGPIRAKAATVGAANGSEWTPNGAADLVTALNTANANPPVLTPSVISPADNQQLALTMATSVSDAGNKIFAVQPVLSFAGANGNVAKVKGLIQDKTLNTQALGNLTNAAGVALNQKYPFQTQAPDGTAWSAAKINQTNFVLIPTT